jgi:hypothetical protein
MPAAIENGQGRIGVGEVDPDLFLPPKIEFEAIALILDTILKKELLHLAGIIFNPLDGRFHLLGNPENTVPLRVL